jgi:hypothetical protein
MRVRFCRDMETQQIEDGGTNGEIIYFAGPRNAANRGESALPIFAPKIFVAPQPYAFLKIRYRFDFFKSMFLAETGLRRAPHQMQKLTLLRFLHVHRRQLRQAPPRVKFQQRRCVKHRV